MDFKHKHINEDLNFNDIQIPQNNILTSYYYDKLLSIFNQHYFRCDLNISTSSGETPMIILKNKIISGSNETLLYIIPKEINGEIYHNIKIIKFRSFTTKQHYIELDEIVNMLVDLSNLIKINRCLLHLPKNESATFDFYLNGRNLKWENIQFLIKHNIKIVFENYMFTINKNNLNCYAETNFKHYANQSDQSKKESILTDFSNIFYPLVGDSINGSTFEIITRKPLKEDLNFNNIKDDNPVITLETIVKETLKTNMPNGHKDEVNLQVFDYKDDVKHYLILINGEILSKIIVNEKYKDETTMYIEWNFSLTNSKIWDYNISKIFNYLLSIPIKCKYVFFKGKSKLPIHLDLRIINLDKLINDNMLVRWQPGFDLHGSQEYCKTHNNIRLAELIEKLSKIFNSYKFNDDDKLL